MTGRVWKACLALGLAVLAWVAGGACGGESIRLLGDEGAVWLVVTDDGGYELAVKGVDKPWESLSGRRSGTVLTATAVRDSVVLFFAEGGHVRYFPQQPKGRPGVDPPEELWPKGTVAAAACPAAGMNFDGMFVLAGNQQEGFSLTRPVTAPTTASGPASTLASRPVEEITGSVALLRYAGQEWTLLSILPAHFVRRPLRAHMAAQRGLVYVLLEHPSEPVLLALDRGIWRHVELPSGLASARPLALIGMPEGILLAALDQAGRVAVARRIAEKWTDPQILQRDDQPAAWDVDAPPAVARLGARTALTWREGENWFFGTVGLDGKIAQTQVTIFGLQMEPAEAAKFMQRFFTAALVLIVVLMFWPGQPLRVAPFSLPATMLPARLTKRAVAFAIDAMPLSLAAVVGVNWFTQTQPSWETVLKGEMPTLPLLYASVIFMTAYPLYCIVMEHRYGATLGKLAMRLRVVADGGRKPRFREVVLRNVSKIPELVPVVAIVPLLFVLLTRYRQRLGDKIAWTVVIDAELSLPPDLTEGPGGSSDRPGGGDQDQER